MTEGAKNKPIKDKQLDAGLSQRTEGSWNRCDVKGRRPISTVQ